MRTGALVRLTRQSEAFWVGRLTTQNASANRGRMVSTTWPIKGAFQWWLKFENRPSNKGDMAILVFFVKLEKMLRSLPDKVKILT